MELKEAKKQLSIIMSQLERVAKEDEFIHDTSNPDERFEADIVNEVAYNLKSVIRLIKHMNKPVLAEGHLTARLDGRYEIEGTDIYFTSGSEIEVWDTQDEIFKRSKITHALGDYSFYNLKNTPLEGALVRCR